MTQRVRFAPSPTGQLHIGTLRAAWFNWLYAKANDAQFILRIEDTDLKRSDPQYEQGINEGLAWLGIVPDEGPIEGGNAGPYRQSERISAGIYQRYVTQLLAKGLAYYCFLSDAELAAAKEAAIAAGEPYVHDRASSYVAEADAAAARAAGKPYVIRFKVTQERALTFKDAIRGEITFDCSLLSDCVLVKSDGSPSYNFAVVVDDALMGITHVIRGEDHISNVPRQILLYEALGFSVPTFAHLPMILGPDKSKLSKRHGATAVTDYRDEGVLADAMKNYLSLLGWSPADGKEVLHEQTLYEQFSLARVNKAGAVFDRTKLLWMNGQYIRKHSPVFLKTALQPFMLAEYRTLFTALAESKQVLVCAAIRDSLSLYSDVNTYLAVFLESEEALAVQRADVALSETQRQVIQTIYDTLQQESTYVDGAAFTALLNTVCTTLECGKGAVFKPLRLALTGRSSGPYIIDMLSFFGRDRVLKRLAAALV